MPQCPRCGSFAKGYMRNTCAVWGQWHEWHNEEEKKVTNGFSSAHEKLMRLTHGDSTQMSLILQLVEQIDGDITIDASRYSNGIIRIHRVAIDTFVISEDEF
jgi:NMD protein affecting ribosome stability and mRNA decay